MSTFTIILSVVLLLIFLISGVIITNASINLGSLKDTSTFFANAYYYSTWAAVLTWVIVALAILSVAGYYILGWVYEAEVPEAAILSSLQKVPSSSWSGWSILFLIIILILVIVNGCLAAATASQISSDPNYNPNVPQQYRAREEAIITAILCLTSAGLLLVWGIVELYYYFYPEEPEKVETVPATTAILPSNTTNNSTIVNKVNNLTPEEIDALKKLLGK